MRQSKSSLVILCLLLVVIECKLNGGLNSQSENRIEEKKERKDNQIDVFLEVERTDSIRVERWIQEHFMDLSPNLKKYRWFYSKLNQECNKQGLLKRENSKVKIEWTNEYQVKSVNMANGGENLELQEYVKDYLIEYLKRNGLSDHLIRQLNVLDNSIVLVSYEHLLIQERMDSRILELQEPE